MSTVIQWAECGRGTPAQPRLGILNSEVGLASKGRMHQVLHFFFSIAQSEYVLVDTSKEQAE